MIGASAALSALAAVAPDEEALVSLVMVMLITVCACAPVASTASRIAP